MATNRAAQIFKTTQLLHIALGVPIAVFGTFVYFYLQQQGASPGEPDILFYMPFGFMIIAILAGRPLFYSTLKKAKGKPFEERLQVFMQAMILRNALFEASGLFAAVVALISGNATLLLLSAIVLVQFFILKPTAAKLKNDIDASDSELKTLNS